MTRLNVGMTLSQKESGGAGGGRECRENMEEENIKAEEIRRLMYEPGGRCNRR